MSIKSVLSEHLPLIVLAFLCWMLIGCNSMVVQKPNPLLTRDCDNPTLKGVTYRDALILSIEQAKAIEECNGRLKILRQ